MIDKSRQDALVMSIYYYCVQQANKYANYKYEREDALQDALEGAMEAARRFDASRGTPFLGYAAPWVKRNLLVGIAKKTSHVKLPAQSNQRIYVKAMKMAAHDGIEKAASEYDLKPVTLRSYIAAVRNTRELTDISDTIGDESQDVEARAIEDDMRRAINAALWMLSEQEKRFIKMKYFSGMDYGQIAATTTITRQRVQQIVVRALAKVKRRSWHLRDFLEG